MRHTRHEVVDMSLTPCPSHHVLEDMPSRTGTPRTWLSRHVLWVMFLGTAVTGCAKRSGEPTRSPDAADAADDIAALERALAVREGQMTAYGLAPARSRDLADAGDGLQKSGGQATSTPQPTSPPQPMVGATAEDTDTPSTAPRDSSQLAGASRCEQVCEIAAAICALEDQICGLLPRHRGDARYQAACDRAGADCQLANEACHACTPT